VVVRHLGAIRKTVAVGSSAILIAGFVSYRAGAFDGLIRSNTPAVEPVEQRTPEVVSDDARPDVVVTDATMFSSSKSIILAPASSPGKSAALPGSKSTAVFTPDLDVPVRPAPPAAPPATPPSQAPPIIGGSKSLAPLIPPAPQKPNSPPAESGPPK
jgi:hypothetical protein